ncbi:MAG: ATPase, partial [Cyanobacteriota bacterium]|nr:ATPase [Cyanobacteriota bacterium]
FGLETTYSPPTEKKIKRYHKLSRKNGSLDGEEKQEYKQLELFIKEVQPFGDIPAPGSLEARIDAFLEEKLP